jgi:hypothetical protein
MKNNSQAGKTSGSHQAQEAGPWDNAALAKLSEWDPIWADQCRTSRSRAMLAIASFIMRSCAAEHRCFPACIVRMPVLSVVADLVNSETSSQVGARRCWQSISPNRRTQWPQSRTRDSRPRRRQVLVARTRTFCVNLKMALQCP